MAELTEPIKKKRGRPKKSAPSDEKQKSETKQFPLTFKCNSELELDLYNHLTSKLYRGAYIKEILIREMVKERPDLALKHGLQNYAPAAPVITQSEPVTVPAAPEPEPAAPAEEPKEEPPKIKRGKNTLSMF